MPSLERPSASRVAAAYLDMESPDNRAQIQKQAKNGIQYIPDDYISFGFEGPLKHMEADEMAKTLQDMNHLIRQVSHSMFKSLAIRLRRARSDADPAYSRASVVLSIQDMYANLSGEADRFFHTLPHNPNPNKD
jgi:hypothetical protein